MNKRLTTRIDILLTNVFRLAAREDARPPARPDLGGERPREPRTCRRASLPFAHATALFCLLAVCGSALADALPRLGCIYYGTVRTCYGGRCKADDGVRVTAYRNGAALNWCEVGAVPLPAFDYQLQISTVAPGQSPDAGTAVEGETISLAATVGGEPQPLMGTTNVVVAGRGSCVRRDLILGTDANGNGLPDEYEAFVLEGFMAMGIYDVTAVNTNDVYNGVTVLDHFLGGTFPFLPGDALRVVGVRSEGGAVELEFLANTTVWYAVGVKTNLGQTGWTVANVGATRETAGAQGAVMGQGDFLKVYVPTNSLRAFYKLFVQ